MTENASMFANTLGCVFFCNIHVVKNAKDLLFDCVASRTNCNAESNKTYMLFFTPNTYLIKMNTIKY